MDGLPVNMNKRNILYLITAVVLIAAIYMTFTSPAINPGKRPSFWSDDEWQNHVDSFRIFYFHVPLAWISYLAFFLVFVASIRYLQTSTMKWDVFAASSAEIGTVFCALNLLSGMIWASSAWDGVYWEWTPRLTFQLILFLLYVAYLMLRRAMRSESRARTSAVFGIIAFAAVPMSYLSIKLWTPLLHPDLTSEGGGIDSPIIVCTLLINILAYTLLYISLITIGMDNERALQESMSSRNP
ncbi:MAG TPA: cytochrome C assembly protein [Methanosarcinales archaeon]|nr:cytochrome C assembly protein [Methanosarcinales archaeon]